MTSSNATAASNPLIPLVRVPIAELRQDPHNARSHDRRNLDAIKASLAKFGQVLPVVVRAGQIVGGNATTIAADELGWTHLDVTPADHLSAEEAVALAVALNRTAELASWDAGVLVDALQGLPTLEGTGFTAEELAELEELIGQGGGGPGLTDPDEVPEPPLEPVTRPGDLWLLGPHRLLCGDATKAEDVERVLAGARPAVMVTDPPYGVDYDPDWRNEAADQGLIAHAASRVGNVQNDDRVDWTEAWALSPSDVAYCWHAGRHASSVQASLEAVGYEIRGQIIWAKSRFAISRGHYHWQHEPCWYAVRKGHSADWIGDRSQTTLWEVNLDKNVEGGHSTQKPVECMARGLRNHLGDVYDPFAGSGSTLMAARQLRRTAYLMDVDPTWVDVICGRWQRFTGEKPILEATGEPHDFTSAP